MQVEAGVSRGCGEHSVIRCFRSRTRVAAGIARYETISVFLGRMTGPASEKLFFVGCKTRPPGGSGWSFSSFRPSRSGGWSVLARSRERRLEYPLWSSGHLGPRPVGTEECVGEDDELSHDGCDGDLRGFSGSDHRFVFCLNVSIEAGRDESWHVESLAQDGATAADVAASAMLSTVARAR